MFELAWATAIITVGDTVATGVVTMPSRDAESSCGIGLMATVIV